MLRLARGFHVEDRYQRVEELKGAPEQQGCDLSKAHIRHDQEHPSGEQA